MTFLELQTEMKRLIRDSSGHMPALIKDCINWVLLDISGRYEWYWWRREWYLATVASYSTGTVAVTGDGYTVTGTSTAWTYQMNGSKIEVGNTTVQAAATDFYRIRKVVSATSLILEHPYRGSTATGQSYIIYKDEFGLRYDVDRINLWRIPSTPQRVVRFFQDELYNWDANPRATGTPYVYRPLGTTKIPYYDLGTASVSNTTIVGLSTAASADATFIGRFFRVDGESRTYEIASVPAKTRFKTLETYGGGKITSGNTYTIDPPGTPLVQLYPIPVTKIYMVYEYQKLPKQLYSDNDQPEIPDKWHEVLVKGAWWTLLKQLNRSQEEIQAAKADYEQYIATYMMPKNTQEEDRVRQMQSINSRRLRFLGPRLPSNYPAQGWGGWYY